MNIEIFKKSSDNQKFMNNDFLILTKKEVLNDISEQLLKKFKKYIDVSDNDIIKCVKSLFFNYQVIDMMGTVDENRINGIMKKMELIK